MRLDLSKELFIIDLSSLFDNVLQVVFLIAYEKCLCIHILIREERQYILGFGMRQLRRSDTLIVK